MRSAIAIGCASLLLLVGGCERTAGRLVASKTISHKDLVVLVQLYTVAHYGAERQAVFWCKSPSSAGVKSKSDAKYLNLQVDSDGWQLMVMDSIFPGERDKPYSEAPVDRVRIVTPEIVFADTGLGGTVGTFDGCRTKSSLGAPVIFQQLFVKDEVHLARESPNPPAFLEHRLSEDHSGLCLRLNPYYVNAPHPGFDVCTVDRGKVWFARTVTGPLAPPSQEEAANPYSDTNRPFVERR